MLSLPTVMDEQCGSCGEDVLGGECPNSKRPCGHHCNCSWEHDCCHWCGAEFGEGGLVTRPDDFLHGGLLEDEDGAPYPEHVQQVVRTLAREVNRLRAEKEPRMTEEPSITQRVLDCPMESNDAGAATVKEYLIKLLYTLWDEEEGFSGKRPFGNSGWPSDVYAALGKAGLVDIEFDEYGYIADCDESAADKLVLDAINSL